MRIFAATPWALKQAFGFFGAAKQIVSIVGGGGKSTLMYFMASTCAKEGKKVLVTTTTNIFEPHPDYYARTSEEAEKLWEEKKIAVIGTPMPGKGKLKKPDEAMLRELLPKADVAFIESDGAKHFPTKVPKDGEPVLLPESDLVIGVFGLSAIGKPLKNCCFRLEQAMELLGVEEDHLLTEADAAEILSSPMGAMKDVGDRKYCVVLNQCDDGKRRRIGNEIAARLALLGVPQVVMTAFDPDERVKYNAMAGVRREN
ncbi:MAG: putative selenium-dependent hydroxylase accessory protein YqeC [Oscillospiraceae bacterium]|nr:putative selenium-dependent hydroxylase accessory protein YqeC [Oscillospiraceae bacterium]